MQIIGFIQPSWPSPCYNIGNKKADISLFYRIPEFGTLSLGTVL